jgi:transcriptional regulator of acetoin/glycerol metabolism
MGGANMGLETVLGSIKEFVMRFSAIISNTIDSDVIIADNNLEIVSTSFRYFTLYNDIEAGSLISEVISKKKKVMVKDKNTRLSCKKCGKFDTCKMVGFVGVPIYYNNYVVGAIALVLPQHRVDSLFTTIDTSIEFLENMAGLLTGKIQEVNQNQSLNQIIIEREAMMDLLSEAVVFTDYYGYIQHFNKTFQKLFSVTQNCIGKLIQELIPHALLQEYFQEHKELKNIRLYFSWGSEAFYGFVSSKQVNINGKDYGTMFAFQTMNHVLKNAQLSEKGSLVTLGWADWMFSRDIIRKAKAFAVTNKNILIRSNNRNINEILAKGITNYSERSLKGLKILYCDNIYRDLMSVFLFDEFGEIRNSDNGTMFVQDVENLPIYIQEKILYFVKTGKVPLNNNTSIGSDVRLIFATTKDLKRLVEQGLFLEELYYRIVENELEISSIQEDFLIFQNIVDNGLAYYAKIYHKNKLYLHESALQYLHKMVNKNDMNYLETVLESLVRHNDMEVTIEELKDMGLYMDIKSDDSSLSSLEKERMAELLKMGISKAEIARRLGIGRATLYRKIEEYGLTSK